MQKYICYIYQMNYSYFGNSGVGARISTRFNAGGNKITNTYQYIYNKYKPGGSGIGASSIAVRRSKNRKATICGENPCYPCFMTLGQYNKSYNINGYYQCQNNQKI